MQYTWVSTWNIFRKKSVKKNRYLVFWWWQDAKNRFYKDGIKKSRKKKT
jgi:hypothetical protein